MRGFIVRAKTKSRDQVCRSCRDLITRGTKKWQSHREPLDLLTTSLDRIKPLGPSSFPSRGGRGEQEVAPTLFSPDADKLRSRDSAQQLLSHQGHICRRLRRSHIRDSDGVLKRAASASIASRSAGRMGGIGAEAGAAHAVHASHGHSWITRVPARNASDSAHYDKRIIVAPARRGQPGGTLERIATARARGIVDRLPKAACLAALNPGNLNSLSRTCRRRYVSNRGGKRERRRTSGMRCSVLAGTCSAARSRTV